jgi:hypothetical protein
MGQDLEGSGHSLTEVLSGNFTGGAGKSQGNPMSLQMVGVSAETGTECFHASYG